MVPDFMTKENDVGNHSEANIRSNNIFLLLVISSFLYKEMLKLPSYDTKANNHVFLNVIFVFSLNEHRSMSGGIKECNGGKAEVVVTDRSVCDRV